MTVDKPNRFDAVPASFRQKGNPVTRHPQIETFVQATESMHENRYWARDPWEQVEFLEALRDVITEVCFHLDRNHVLDPRGLATFAAAGEGQYGSPWMGHSAESVLLPELDGAIQQSLAAVVTRDNTGEEPAV